MDDLSFVEKFEDLEQRGHAMPPLAPMVLEEQRFDRCKNPRPMAEKPVSQKLLRYAVFGPPLALSLALAWGFAGWLSSGGVKLLEAVLIALVAMTFVWVSLSVSTVILGFLYRSFGPAPKKPPQGEGLDVALTILTYNEDPVPVFSNALAMAEALEHDNGSHRFTFFILSDTQDPQIAMQERDLFAELQDRAPLGVQIYYRKRVKNTNRKIGNIAEWLAKWGGAFDGFLVLDADSLMTAEAICILSDRLEADPNAGLVQSFPRLVGAQTLFARMQQFASYAYGGFLSVGLATWAQTEGNYWGHNAIIRCKAFAEAAHLPRLGARQSLIMSHDFVEAALLRRAGWAVCFERTAQGSFEETPPSLVDHALRDRRWCRGNLQHLRLLGATGLSWVSRFHLLQGAVGFLLAPAWLVLILIWSALELMPLEQHSYFNASNPLYPVWPMMGGMEGGMFLVLVYGMLLLPKLLGACALMMQAESRVLYGSGLRIGAITLGEVVLSILYAPVLMMQQSMAVLMALYGRAGWSPQSRDLQQRSWGELLRFHWVETVFGSAMLLGCVLGVLSFWLLPVAVCLTNAVPLSWVSGMSSPLLGLVTPDDVDPVRERRRAMSLRTVLGRRSCQILGGGRGMQPLPAQPPVLSGQPAAPRVVAHPPHS